MSSKIRQAKRSSLASSCGKRRSRLAAKSRCIRCAVDRQRTGYPCSTSAWPRLASRWLFPAPGLPTTTTFTACCTNAPLRSRSICCRMSGGKAPSCKVRKVFSRGRPDSDSNRARRRCSRASHSSRTSSCRYASWLKPFRTALSAISEKLSAIVGSLRERSWLVNSVYRLLIAPPISKQLVVQRQIDYPRRQLGHRWALTRMHKRAHGLVGGGRADLQEQRQRGFNLRLTPTRRQVQNAQVVLVGALGVAATQAVVGLAKQQRGKERVVIAVLRKGTRLAHQRIDQVAIVNLLLVLPAHPRQGLQSIGAQIELEHLGPHPHRERVSNQARWHRIGIAQDPNGRKATDCDTQFLGRVERHGRQGRQAFAFLDPFLLARLIAQAHQVAHEAQIGCP